MRTEERNEDLPGTKPWGGRWTNMHYVIPGAIVVAYAGFWFAMTELGAGMGKRIVSRVRRRGSKSDPAG